MQSTFQLQADAKKKIKLESNMLYALWTSGAGRINGTVGVEVRTTFVGEGAPIEIVGKSESGKKLGKLKDTMSRNRFVGELEVLDKVKPGDQIYFEAKLPRHNLKMESNRIPVRPSFLIQSMQWGQQQVAPDDEVTLTTVFVSGVEDGQEALIKIFEYDDAGHHDPIASIPAVVKAERIELVWKFHYPTSEENIPTAAELRAAGRTYSPPKYFFIAVIDGIRIGVNQESGFLTEKEDLTGRFTFSG